MVETTDVLMTEAFQSLDFKLNAGEILAQFPFVYDFDGDFLSRQNVPTQFDFSEASRTDGLINLVVFVELFGTMDLRPLHRHPFYTFPRRE